MLGFFDSGLGGLTILHAVLDRQPGAYIYLGDNQRAPYGTRSAQEVLRFTWQGVRWLIARGCDLIILACNTASANALRRIQQQWLPGCAPDVRVLGILVPTVEAITGVPWHAEWTDDNNSTILIFATPSTVASRAYEREIAKRLPRARVVSEACPTLAVLLESGASQEQLREVVRRHVASGVAKLNQQPDVVLLGCTHYALVDDVFCEHFEPSVKIISQPDITAGSLQGYLARHVEFATVSGAPTQFFTTGDAAAVAAASKYFFDRPVIFQRAVLD